MKSYRFDQIPLVCAIINELSRQHPGLPADGRMGAITKAANDIIAEYGRDPVMATPGMTLQAWLESDDTGLSSLYMAWCLNKVAGLQEWHEGVPQNNYPHDVDDLGRCIRLRDAVPAFGGRIHEMESHGAHWAAVANNWDEWVDMYHAGDVDRLSREMLDAFAKAGA